MSHAVVAHIMLLYLVDSKLTEDSLTAETSFNKRLTFIFPKMLGIGITVKGGTNMPDGPAVYIDKVIRGLDAAKVRCRMGK